MSWVDAFPCKPDHGYRSARRFITNGNGNANAGQMFKGISRVTLLLTLGCIFLGREGPYDFCLRQQVFGHAQTGDCINGQPGGIDENKYLASVAIRSFIAFYVIPEACC